MIYSTIFSIGECNPHVSRQQDGRLQVYPTGVGGTVLIVTEDEWSQLVRAFDDYLKSEKAKIGWETSVPLNHC